MTEQVEEQCTNKKVVKEEKKEKLISEKEVKIKNKEWHVYNKSS